MKIYDKYDLLISAMGFPIDGIADDLIEQNQDEINNLKEELGMTSKSNLFNLILLDDKIHDMLEVVGHLLEIGCGAEKSLDIMNKAHNTGSAIVKSGSYKELVKLRNKLRQEKYKAIIRRKEEE